jgi:hypothetical protein
MHLLLLSALALADDDCTEDKCADDEKAKTCKATAEDRGDCEAYEDAGYKKRCQAGDDKEWTEVLCKKKEPVKVNVQQTQRDIHSVDMALRRCDTTSGGAVGLLTILVAAGLSRRR